MFIRLKSESHIDAVKIVSISANNENYLIEMRAGPKMALSSSEYAWLIKICGFLIELKSGDVINTFEIVSIDFRDGVPMVCLSTGTIFELTPQEVISLMGAEEKQNGEVKNGHCESLNLENRIAFLESKNVNNEDYKKI